MESSTCSWRERGRRQSRKGNAVAFNPNISWPVVSKLRHLSPFTTAAAATVYLHAAYCRCCCCSSYQLLTEKDEKSNDKLGHRDGQLDPRGSGPSMGAGRWMFSSTSFDVGGAINYAYGAAGMHLYIVST